MSEEKQSGGGITSSISSFLKRTENIGDNFKTPRIDVSDFSPYVRDTLSPLRDTRASSVARASSVSRQFDPLSSFTRGSSVAPSLSQFTRASSVARYDLRKKT